MLQPSLWPQGTCTPQHPFPHTRPPFSEVGFSCIQPREQEEEAQCLREAVGDNSGNCNKVSGQRPEGNLQTLREASQPGLSLHLACGQSLCF